MLQPLAQPRQEQRAAMTVADAMVGAQRRGQHRHRNQGAAVYLRLLGDTAEADERHLPRVDRAEYRLDTLVAKVGDGDRRIRQLETAQAAGATALYQVGQFAHQQLQRLGGDIVQRWRDQPSRVQGDRDADM